MTGAPSAAAGWLFPPPIAEQRNRVSSYGWAMGYMGGGLLLALNRAFYLLHEHLGVPTGLAIRINLMTAGLGWFGWSFLTWARLHQRQAARRLPRGETDVSVGFQTVRQEREVRGTAGVDEEALQGASSAVARAGVRH